VLLEEAVLGRVSSVGESVTAYDIASVTIGLLNIMKSLSVNKGRTVISKSFPQLILVIPNYSTILHLHLKGYWATEIDAANLASSKPPDSLLNTWTVLSTKPFDDGWYRAIWM